jgi:hypothetical protein
MLFAPETSRARTDIIRIFSLLFPPVLSSNRLRKTAIFPSGVYIAEHYTN